jgi:hypothetical protein
MEAVIYRFLFQNTGRGIYHSGCIWDKYKQDRLNFIYSNGIYEGTEKDNKSIYRFLPVEPIGLYILSDYNLFQLDRLLKILKQTEIKEIVLPYLAPVQRMVLKAEAEEQGWLTAAMSHFLNSPFHYLKKHGIEKVYFLHGTESGQTLSCHRQDLELPFKNLFQNKQEIIRRMEGHEYPVYCAGKMFRNGWLFQYAHFGTELDEIWEFTRKFLDLDSEESGEMEQQKLLFRSEALVKEYHERFGSVSASSSIVLYHGPVDDDPVKMDSMCFSKSIGKNEECCVTITEENEICMLKCYFKNDFDTLKMQNNSFVTEYNNGVLLLGNINLKEHINFIMKYYGSLLKKARIISVPNSGKKGYWNSEIMNMKIGAENRRFWICNNRPDIDERIPMEIFLSDPYNRLIPITDDYGLCMTGFLKKWNDEKKPRVSPIRECTKDSSER